jgi:hypothetical protein
MEYAFLVYGDAISAQASVGAATTVRGDTVTDGPATVANETLECVRVLIADSLDEAIELAQQLRHEVTVEIRPVSQQ